MYFEEPGEVKVWLFHYFQKVLYAFSGGFPAILWRALGPCPPGFLGTPGVALGGVCWTRCGLENQYKQTRDKVIVYVYFTRLMKNFRGEEIHQRLP